MKDEFETQLESIVKANIDGFFADLRTEAGQVDLEKSVRQIREGEDLEQQFRAFEEEMLFPSTGRTGPAPRLRSERYHPEPGEWKPGDDPDVGLGLQKSGDRRKLALRGWLASQLAIGKSATELIEHAARHDLQTANLLRELAAELQTT
jgi:hypothetical protein